MILLVGAVAILTIGVVLGFVVGLRAAMEAVDSLIRQGKLKKQ
jgi:hypothetical protein